MARTVEYLRAARTDFDESFDWYAERSVGAAIGFAAAVDDAICMILDHPERFPQSHGGCGYCALKRFPFRIVFRVEASRLVIIAIAHAKREPGYWQRRL